MYRINKGKEKKEKKGCVALLNLKDKGPFLVDASFVLMSFCLPFVVYASINQLNTVLHWIKQQFES